MKQMQTLRRYVFQSERAPLRVKTAGAETSNDLDLANWSQDAKTKYMAVPVCK
jgi:hypothetical protein